MSSPFASFLFLELITLVSSSDHLEEVVYQLSQAIASAIHSSQPQYKFLPHMLSDLTRMGNRPTWLTERAYEWCSMICKNYQNLEDGQILLFLSLEIGFRHLDPKSPWNVVSLTHTEHHSKMADIIFESGDHEAITNLLLAWTLGDEPPSPQRPLNACARHITLLPKPHLFSLRLQQVIIHSIITIGYEGFKEAGVEEFVALLDNLHFDTDNPQWKCQWVMLLLDVLQSSEAAQLLSQHHWKSLVELVIQWSEYLEYGWATYNPQIMTNLKGAQEWDKLECWIGVVWLMWPPENDKTMEMDLEDGMLLLSHKQPGSIQRLQQWMGQWKGIWYLNVPQSFGRICEEANPKRAHQNAW